MRAACATKLDLLQAWNHTYRYVNYLEQEYKVRMMGMKTRYKKPNNRRTVSDGRGPDTTKALFPRNKSNNSTKASQTKEGDKTKEGSISIKANQGHGSKSKAPDVEVNIDESSVGMRWGVSYDFYRESGLKATFSASNTCPLDTPLMAWYLLQRYRGAELPQDVLNTRAGQVLANAVHREY
jgi:hypothetical protein